MPLCYWIQNKFFFTKLRVSGDQLLQFKAFWFNLSQDLQTIKHYNNNFTSLGLFDKMHVHYRGQKTATVIYQPKTQTENIFHWVHFDSKIYIFQMNYLKWDYLLKCDSAFGIAADWIW